METIKYFLRKDGDCERPAVLWSWTGKINPEDIVYQIEQFKETKIDEIYVEPVWGLEIDDYLSDFFMDMIKLVSDTCEKLGIKFSLYDEYSWPSCVCAGKVIEDDPDMCGTYLRWYDQLVEVGDPTEIWYKGEILSVQVEYYDKLNKREDITDQVTIEKFNGVEAGIVHWRSKACCAVHVWVFCKIFNDSRGANIKWASFSREVKGYTDMMNKKAVRKFIDINNEVYRKKVGDQFGKNIKRLFSDEVSLANQDHLFPNTIAYSIVLENEFEKEHGYPIRDHFIALTKFTMEDSDIKVRHDYYKTCARLYREAYIEQVADWCHENNLEFTGHLRGNGHLYHMALQQGDCYLANAGMDIPGLDSVGSYHHLPREDFAGEGKLVASIAKFSGKNRTHCETFSGSGWIMRMEDAKRIMNKVMLPGVTYLTYQSCGFSSNEGLKMPPIGYPPNFGHNNPAFYHYHELTDYAAIRSSVMTQTTPLGSTLVMLPNVNAWLVEYNELWRHKPEGFLDACWYGCSMAMQKASLEHDIFFESLANDMQVENAKAVVKGYTYDTIIVPRMRYSNQETLDQLENFAKQGGRLVFVDSFPFCAADTLKKYDFAAICELSEEGRGFFDQEEDFGVHVEGNVMLIRVKRKELYSADIFRKNLCDFVRVGSAEEIVKGDNLPKGVYISRRKAEGLYSAFVFNDTEETKTVKLRINSDDEICVLEGLSVRNCTRENGMITLEIPPYDMPVVMLKGKNVEIKAPVAEEKPRFTGESHSVSFDKEWRFDTVEPNMLTLMMRYLTKTEPNGSLSPELMQLAENANSPHAIYCFPAEIGFGEGYAAYARFEVKDIPEYLELFNEVVGGGELWLNGHLLTGFTKTHMWGPQDSITEITPYVKKGINTLIMIHRVPSWEGPHGMPWAVVRGKFRLDSNNAITVSDNIVEPTIYTSQGWKYFGGNCSYAGSFILTEQDAGHIVISLDTREMVEVVVNGMSAGKLYWRPYELDITEFCHQGRNSLELKMTTNYLSTVLVTTHKQISKNRYEFIEDIPNQQLGLRSVPTITIFEA